MRAFLREVGNFIVWAVGKLTNRLATFFAIGFYVPFFRMFFVEGDERTYMIYASIAFFVAFILFAAIHCLWMWRFYRIDVLKEIFKSPKSVE